MIITFWVTFRRKNLSLRQKWSLDLLLVTLIIQFVLGVATLLYVVPLNLAAIHQAGAFVLLFAALFTNHSLRDSP